MYFVWIGWMWACQWNFKGGSFEWWWKKNERDGVGERFSSWQPTPPSFKVRIIPTLLVLPVSFDVWHPNAFKHSWYLCVHVNGNMYRAARESLDHNFFLSYLDSVWRANNKSLLLGAYVSNDPTTSFTSSNDAFFAGENCEWPANACFVKSSSSQSEISPDDWCSSISSLISSRHETRDGVFQLWQAMMLLLTLEVVSVKLHSDGSESHTPVV